MKRSIASRTFRIILLNTLATLSGALGFGWWSLETLESTMLDVETSTEIEYFEKYGDKEKPLRITTAHMVSIYQPKKMANGDDLPIIFQNIPVPYQGEIDALGTSYIVITHAFAEGTFYIAKDLQLFEEREAMLVTDMLTLSVVIFLIAFGVAVLTSRNISNPVVRLTGQLRELDTKTTGARMSTNYSDTELNEITHAINHYLHGLEDGINRERTLISMASHELKTPISVILGAAHVIESRNKLSPDDVITLNRIIDTAKEMSANIHALLNLIRHSKEAKPETFYWSELFESISQDYYIQDPGLADRLQFLQADADNEINSDRVLVKMLLRNLINNALNHTLGNVIINVDEKTLVVSDEGIDLSNHDNPQEWQTSGLGLFIVDLICKQLQWHYEIIPNSAGSSIKVYFETDQERG